VRHAVARIVDQAKQRDDASDRRRVEERRAAFVAGGHAERLEPRDDVADLLVGADEDADRSLGEIAMDARRDARGAFGGLEFLGFGRELGLRLGWR
jgi:hypothetical protein